MYPSPAGAKGPGAGAPWAGTAGCAGASAAFCGRLNLKSRGAGSDTMDMFESVSTPAFAGELRALRFSLNSPVVAIGGLPAGPTSAAAS